MDDIFQVGSKGASDLLFEGIILKSSSQIKDERTITAVYHLLTGRRSIQTVQDSHLYQLEHFYGIYKVMDKSVFDHQIAELMTAGLLLKAASTDMYYPSTRGYEWLEKHEDQMPIAYFNGLQYESIDQVFLSRLLLLIQVLTNGKMRNPSYIPVIDQLQITDWVKRAYQDMKQTVTQHLHMVYTELSGLLHDVSTQEAAIFVDRLTGFKQYGMSLQQLGTHYKLDTHDVRLVLIAITHRLLGTIRDDAQRYPFMTSLIQDLSMDGFITNSAHKTYDFIKQGYTAAEIANRRALKMNTLYDHIVEIALYDQRFSLSPYLNEETRLEIVNTVIRIGSTKLSQIKKEVDSEISYFQIRLALTTVDNIFTAGDLHA